VNLQEIELLKKSGFISLITLKKSYVVFYNLSDSEIDPQDIYFSRLNMQEFDKSSVFLIRRLIVIKDFFTA
jgi:hypothetical protein